ncbi:hypothetical protein [Jannaschia sp. W003]|uniref:hypothetical protein n=1 Tax=Jannaschia sp. W003 TaxID=2867012 RepID=UPI0021A262A4|nr:hypothetical protein [Jannaschia sp. W003]UWQ20085.1 hypothetical protein K3554_08685 [Jannaschia sp. W003]
MTPIALDAALAAAAFAGYDQPTLDAGREAWLRKRRVHHPAGTWDKAGRFQIDEHCLACDRIRAPSRAWPKTRWNHGHTPKHVAALHGACATRVGRVMRVLDLFADLGPDASAHDHAAAEIESERILRPGKRTRRTVEAA